MAELATIARPYAEALFKAVSAGDADATAAQLQSVAAVAADPKLRSFADNPKVQPDQVFALITSVAQTELGSSVKNLLGAMIDNGRLAALPEVASQFHALVGKRSGVADATVYSAFPIDEAQVADLAASLEKRFGRRLAVTVHVEPELIGGVKVVVGDEVLDTSVKARLERMKTALTA
jgi:F-type H+-transporting ATPase subunit delta